MSPGRPLHSAEREALQCFSSIVDLDRIRIYGHDSLLARIMAPFTRGGAIALGYRIVSSRHLILPTLAHELTHVVQYRQWGALRYYAVGAWNQLILRGLLRRDVYHWEAKPGATFADYGMEQQGQIVQDCFDVNSPSGATAQRISPYRPSG